MLVLWGLGRKVCSTFVQVCSSFVEGDVWRVTSGGERKGNAEEKRIRQTAAVKALWRVRKMRAKKWELTNRIERKERKEYTPRMDADSHGFAKKNQSAQKSEAVETAN